MTASPLTAEGVYTARIIGQSLRKSSNGNPFLTLQMEITAHPEAAGDVLWCRIFFTEKTRARAEARLEGLGAKRHADGRFNLAALDQSHPEAENFTGQLWRVKVRHVEYQGETHLDTDLVARVEPEAAAAVGTRKLTREEFLEEIRQAIRAEAPKILAELLRNTQGGLPDEPPPWKEDRDREPRPTKTTAPADEEEDDLPF